MIGIKRRDFYKEYYEITDRRYADRRVRTAKDEEQAWRKGQIYNISKTERKFSIVVQYVFLLLGIVFFITDQCVQGCVFCFLFLGCSLIKTNFSIIMIEALFFTYRRNNPYAELLYQAFSRKIDGFWHLVLPQAKKKVSGFVCVNNNYFAPKYSICFRKKREEDIFLVIKPSKIELKSKTYKVVFNDPTISLKELADEISDVLREL